MTPNAALPDGHTRADVTESSTRPLTVILQPTAGLEPLSSLLARRHASIAVAARPLSDFDTAANTTSITTRMAR